MLHYIFIILVSLIVLESCAQSKNAYRSYVFNQPSIKGNIPVNDEGIPVHSGIDTFYFAIIELENDNVLEVDSIRYKGNFIPASAFKIEEKQWIAGTPKNNSQLIVLEAGEGRSFWRIEFTPSLKSHNSFNKPILIKGKINGKQYQIELKQEIELLPVENY